MDRESQDVSKNFVPREDGYIMASILIVDDNKIKLDAMKAILSSLEIPEEDISYAGSAIAAKKELLETQFDILLLDLALPVRDGTEPIQSGGIDLLYEIADDRVKLKMPKNIFAISEYDDALNNLQSNEDKFHLSLIKYDATSDNWKSRLISYINQINRTHSEQSTTYEYDVAIICALSSPELDEVLARPFNWKAHAVLGDSTDYYVGTYRNKRLICAAAYEMGMPAASVLATKIALRFRPHYLIMTGIAAGVSRDKLEFGDIVVADPCFDYGSGKRTFENGTSGFKPDYRQVRLNDQMCQIINRIGNQSEIFQEIKDSCPYDKPDSPLRLHIGPFASGASVLADPTIVSGILEHSRKLLGFDMEAYGVALSGTLACAPKPIPIIMKSVSDFGDTEKKDDYQKYASYTSAKILEYFFDELFPLDKCP